MSTSPRLSLSYLAPQQAQKHVTVNETFRRLDALVQLSVKSAVAAAQPASPAEGDAYILPAGKTGADWAAMADLSIAVFQDGAWIEISPVEGFHVWVAGANEFLFFDGAVWTGPSRFGVGANPDATNRLNVRSNAVLFDALDAGEGGSGDSQVKVNKEAAGDTASHLFSTNFSGRAELGLTGDDNFHVKVTPDNFTTTFDSIVVDKNNGFVGIDIGAPDGKFHVNGGVIAGDQTNATFDSGFLIKRPLDATPRTFAIVENDTELRMGGGAWTQINFWTGSPTASNKVMIAGGLVAGAPTGGDKGVGTINAQAVYDDGILLTCYVFEQALDGAIDFAKWDDIVPDRHVVEHDPDTGEVLRDKIEKRTHEPLRKFAARAGTPYNPLTLDGYAAHWREKRHLTSMPNKAHFDPVNGQLATGEWIQRLVETVEIQAVLIEQLNERVKTLEAGRQ